MSKENWPKVNLGTICEFKYGKSLPKSKRDGGEFNVYGSNGIVGTHSEAITDGETIVIGRKGSFGEVNYSANSCWPIDTTYFVDRSATKQHLRWLAYRLTRLGLTDLNKSAAIPGLNREDAYRQTLLLPPLDEQKRIAEVLDRAEALRAQRRAALALLDELTQSIFLDMFGDPVTNPNGWDICSLESVTTKITDGTHKTPKYVNEGIEFLSAKDLKYGGIMWGTNKFISKEEHVQLIKRCNPELGDLLLAKSGSLGSVAIIDREHDFSLFESLCLIKYVREKLNPQYLVELLRCPPMLDRLLQNNKGVAVKHLHLVDVRRLQIPLPDLKHQDKFSQVCMTIQKQKERYQKSLSQLDELFASFQQRAFKGELFEHSHEPVAAE